MSEPAAAPAGSGFHLVALDVDGTVVDYDDQMSDDVRSAIRTIDAFGHHVVLATGRSVQGTLPVVDRLRLTRGFAVCGNGSVTVRLDPELEFGWEVHTVVTFDPAPALTRLHEIAPASLFMLEDETLTRWVTAPFPENELKGQQEIATFEEMLTKTATRIVMRDPSRTAEQFEQAIHSAGLHGVGYSIGWTAWLDVSPDGVSKASALENVRRLLQVDPENTFAAGDGTNDIEMLQWARRAVAMGNAAEPLKAVANEITGTVHDDGLVDALKPLLG